MWELYIHLREYSFYTSADLAIQFLLGYWFKLLGVEIMLNWKFSLSKQKTDKLEHLNNVLLLLLDKSYNHWYQTLLFYCQKRLTVLKVNQESLTPFQNQMRTILKCDTAIGLKAGNFLQRSKRLPPKCAAVKGCTCAAYLICFGNLDWSTWISYVVYHMYFLCC